MKIKYNIAILSCIILMSGCEKGISDEESGNGGNPTSGIPAELKQRALTIEEAQQVSNGTKDICVKGYIVASTRQSMGNATFKTPFEGNTAIVLASKKHHLKNPVPTTDKLFPICLTDGKKGLKEAFNLEDHPEYWNKYVFIVGEKNKYMSLDGLKKITAIEIDDAAGDDNSNDYDDIIVIHFTNGQSSSAED